MCFVSIQEFWIIFRFSTIFINVCDTACRISMESDISKLDYKLSSDFCTPTQWHQNRFISTSIIARQKPYECIYIYKSACEQMVVCGSRSEQKSKLSGIGKCG